GGVRTPRSHSSPRLGDCSATNVERRPGPPLYRERNVLTCLTVLRRRAGRPCLPLPTPPRSHKGELSGAKQDLAAVEEPPRHPPCIQRSTNDRQYEQKAALAIEPCELLSHSF